MALDYTHLPPQIFRIRTIADAIASRAYTLTATNTGTVPVTLGDRGVAPGAAGALTLPPGETADIINVNRPYAVYAVAPAAGELTLYRLNNGAEHRAFIRAEVARETGVPASLLTSDLVTDAAYEADLRTKAGAITTWKSAA